MNKWWCALYIVIIIVVSYILYSTFKNDVPYAAYVYGGGAVLLIVLGLYLCKESAPKTTYGGFITGVSGGCDCGPAPTTGGGHSSLDHFLGGADDGDFQ